MSTKLVIPIHGKAKQVLLSDEEEAQRDAEEKAWTDEEPKRNALNEIHRLEGTITPRRLRDSVLTDEGKAWLTDVEANIATERKKLQEHKHEQMRTFLFLILLSQIGCATFVENVAQGFIGNIASDTINREIEKQKSECKNPDDQILPNVNSYFGQSILLDIFRPVCLE